MRYAWIDSPLSEKLCCHDVVRVPASIIGTENPTVYRYQHKYLTVCIDQRKAWERDGGRRIIRYMEMAGVRI